MSAAREPWTPDRIMAIVQRRGSFSTGPRYSDDQARRVAVRMVKKGLLRQESVGFRAHIYRLPDAASRAGFGGNPGSGLGV